MLYSCQNIKKSYILQEVKRMAESEENLDVFGKFIVQNIRDNIISEVEALILGNSMMLHRYEMAQKLRKFNEEDLGVIWELCVKSIDSGLSNFLYELNEISGSQKHSRIKVLVDDEDVTEIEPFLQNELCCNEGWIERFSRYPKSQ
jgi:hypothetical protein